MMRMNAYLFAILVTAPGEALTPGLPVVDRVEMISRNERKISLANCDEWARKHERHKVRATMSDRGAGQVWSNNCVFSSKIGGSK